MFKLSLQRSRYYLKNLFAKKIIIPSKINNFEYTYPKYHKLLVSYLLSNSNNEINYSKKIFGKETDNFLTSKDIFNEIDFESHNKFKPAYFNKGDVKVPYEASRLQFLQKLDLLSILNKEHNFHESVAVDKFPMIYWNSPMDVAIRNINLIFHRNFLEENNLDLQILDNNKKLIDSVISQHYQFIIENLENKGNVVGNHYLIELCSIILTLATYKFENRERDLNYFINEFSNQLDNQFYEDGTNFEGSSHYSAFVTEALLLSKLALDAIQPNSHLIGNLTKLINSNKNLLSLLMVNGELSQIGDNDSGRIFYFYFDEDSPLKMDWLIDLIENFVEDTAKNLNIKEINDLNIKDINLENYLRVDHPPIKVFNEDFNLYSFKNFGIFIWRNIRGTEHFSIRCGKFGQNGIGGHSHYDQLSIECHTNGKWIARDPGTGTYTDDIGIRNKFRSMIYHWGPNADLEFPYESEFDCFKLTHAGEGKVLELNKFNFLGSALFNGKEIFRKVIIENGTIFISDFSKDVQIKPYNNWGELNNGAKFEFSEGYKRLI